jgi:hypothetical protein
VGFCVCEREREREMPANSDGLCQVLSVGLDSAAAGLLGLRVRIPAVTWISVICVLCCQVEVSATG